jgi:hypothetical protein
MRETRHAHTNDTCADVDVLEFSMSDTSNCDNIIIDADSIKYIDKIFDAITNRTKKLTSFTITIVNDLLMSYTNMYIKTMSHTNSAMYPNNIIINNHIASSRWHKLNINKLKEIIIGTDCKLIYNDYCECS